MVFTGAGQLGINVINRSGHVVDPALFIPPMKFEIEKTIVPTFVYEGVLVTSEILSFHHDESNFQIYRKKDLNEFDVTSGFMV